MTRWAVVVIVLWVACGGRQAGTAPVRSPQTLQSLSAGWLGCPASEVTITDARDVGEASSWRASCGEAVMICSLGRGSARCSPLRADAREESPLEIRDLPPQVAECIARPVPVEVLFEEDGRILELRPWPGETAEQRRCVERVMVEIDAPTSHGGPVLVRFEPRDPWRESER